MKRAIYSRRPDAFKDVCPDPEVYIAPKAIAPRLKSVGCPIVAVEDVDKTETWLWLNEAVKDGTRVVYDRVSRYYKVGSEKARKLSRLAEIGNVSLVDIVPFCEHRRFLYMPWRYVSRTVLGYAHFYAFSGDHGEEVDGRIVNSLDASLLCMKISPHVAACELRTNAAARTVTASPTDKETREYLDKRDRLFSKYKTPQPILTRLADLAHAFASRREVVCQILDRETAVICNLASYAKHYQDAVPGAAAGTYAKPPRRLRECRRVVFAEPPIVMTYKRLDIESLAQPGVELIDIVGGCKVDCFLSGRIRGELEEIDGFIKVLRESLQTAERP